METEADITDEVQKWQLMWLGYIGMEETGWPMKVWEWGPHERHKRGRPRRGWRDVIMEARDRRGIAKEACQRREEWKLGAEWRRHLGNNQRIHTHTHTTHTLAGFLEWYYTSVYLYLLRNLISINGGRIIAKVEEKKVECDMDWLHLVQGRDRFWSCEFIVQVNNRQLLRHTL